MIDSGLSLAQVFGFTKETPRQAWLAARGDRHVPRSRFGVSSVKMFTPMLSLSTWAGRRALGRRVPIVNLPNRTQTPIEEGWSVRKTQVRDFRGGTLSYDSHNGTDFAVPPGTDVVTAAAGTVVAIRNEFNRGGLKVYVDHGAGLWTSYHHLACALVEVGQRVARGQVLARSGYSGIDAVISFPWMAPHVHFNCYLGGVVVDPFAAAGEQPLWRGADGLPTPAPDGDEAAASTTQLDAAAVDAVLALVIDDERKAALAAIADVNARGWALAIEAAVYPTRFSTKDAGRALFPPPVRVAALDLPFARRDFDGVAFV